MSQRRHEPIPFGAPRFGPEESEELLATLDSGWLSTGPRVARFELLFAERVGARHAVAVTSCTAGLHVSLLAAGVRPGDEVITTSVTFCATAHAIVHAGARPVFVDVEPDTGNIDPDAIERAIGPRTVGIVPVHLAGRPCRIERICQIAERSGLFVVEDAAHAVGASVAARCAGTWGLTGCFSFHATKAIATGEGGMVVTDDPAIAERVRLLSRHGLSEDTWTRTARGGYRHQVAIEAGYKFNMTDIQAALGIHQLARLDVELSRRAELWRRYDELLSGLPIDRPAPVSDGEVHAHQLYSPRLRAGTARDRDAVLDELLRLGVGTGVHFAAIHLHPYYREKLGHRPGELPEAERFGAATFSLPLSSRVTIDDLDHVAHVVRLAVAVGERGAA